MVGVKPQFMQPDTSSRTCPMTTSLSSLTSPMLLILSTEIPYFKLSQPSSQKSFLYAYSPTPTLHIFYSVPIQLSPMKGCNKVIPSVPYYSACHYIPSSYLSPVTWFSGILMMLQSEETQALLPPTLTHSNPIALKWA